MRLTDSRGTVGRYRQSTIRLAMSVMAATSEVWTRQAGEYGQLIRVAIVISGIMILTGCVVAPEPAYQPYYGYNTYTPSPVIVGPTMIWGGRGYNHGYYHGYGHERWYR
jgi:hypothetical protein